jgi:hypothetical protein
MLESIPEMLSWQNALLCAGCPPVPLVSRHSPRNVRARNNSQRFVAVCSYRSLSCDNVGRGSSSIVLLGEHIMLLKWFDL